VAEVIWSESALADIDELAEFIARDSKVYADQMVTEIFERAAVLERFPKVGKKVPERNDPTYRELQVPPFRILYKVEEGKVTILAAIHARRNARKVIGKLK